MVYTKAAEDFSKNHEKYAGAAEVVSKTDPKAINFALFGIGFAGLGIGCWKLKKTFYLK